MWQIEKDEILYTPLSAVQNFMIKLHFSLENLKSVITGSKCTRYNI